MSAPFACFKCRDENTPLYCLNCANEESKTQLDSLHNAIFRAFGALPGVSAEELVEVKGAQLAAAQAELEACSKALRLTCGSGFKSPDEVAKIKAERDHFKNCTFELGEQFAKSRSALSASEKSRLEMRRLLTLLRPQVAIWLVGTGELEEIDKALSETPPTDYVKVEQLHPTIDLLRRVCSVLREYPLDYKTWVPSFAAELIRLESLKEGKA